MMWGYGGVGWGWLWVLSILVGIGLLVYVAIRVSPRAEQSRPTAKPPAPVSRSADSDGAESARRILEERYARGEIDTDEFNERLRALMGG